MHRWLLSIVCVVLGFGFLSAGEIDGKGSGLSKPATTVPFAHRVLQGFNMRVWLSNKLTMGLQAWDCGSGSCMPDYAPYGLEYPTGSGIEHIYGAGPWFGGIIDGRRLASESYNGDNAQNETIPPNSPLVHFWRTYVGASEFATQPDPLGYNGYYFNTRQIVDRRGCDDDNDGKIDEDDLDGSDNDGDWNPAFDDVGIDGLPDSLEVSCNELSYDPVTNHDPYRDNYEPAIRDSCRPDANGNFPFKFKKDVYTEKNGIPDHGEPHVDEDYGAVSESDYYCFATDTFRIPIVSGHVPMGIKIIQKAYSWRGEIGEGIMPFDLYYINIGRKTIRDVFVGFFADLDVGPVNVNQYWTHNYSCYMESLRTAYIHNPLDRGTTPIGITVLRTPRSLDSLKYIFQWFDFTTSPGPGTNDSAIYSWMSGEAVDPDIKPCQSSDRLSDTRFMFSFGQDLSDPTPSKFKEFKPGDTLKVSLALVLGNSVDEGTNNMKENAEKVLKLFSRGYVPPTVPKSPPLKIEQGFKSVRLSWYDSTDTTSIDPTETWDDSNKYAQSFPDTHWRRKDPPCDQGAGGCSGHICTYDSTGKPWLPGGRIFSGYKVYRSEDPGEAAVPPTFTLLKQVQLADDASLDDLRNFNRDSTTFVDSNLVRGKRYWYAVTTFGIPDITLIPIVQPDGSVRYDTLRTKNSESDITENAQKVDLSFSVDDSRLGSVLVVPNPYRVDQEYTYENGGWEGRGRDWTENNRKIKFIHLPTKCTIRIFTLAGDQVAELHHEDPVRGELEWNLVSGSNRALASGVYVFTVESDLGRQIGKFVLIR